MTTPDPVDPPPPVHVLFPSHDEAPRIAAVVRGAAAHLPVLVVDDGSTDGTAAVAREAGADVLEQRPTGARERRCGPGSAGRSPPATQRS